MAKYTRAANVLKQKVEDYLRKEGIKFTIKIVDDSEPEWPKVAVDVTVDLRNYRKVLKLWSKLCEVGFRGMSKEDIHGVMLHVEPFYRHG